MRLLSSGPLASLIERPCTAQALVIKASRMPRGTSLPSASRIAGVGHEVTDVADEQERTTVQAEFAAVDCGVLTVAVERAGEGLGALLDLLGQVTAVETQPVSVADNLVVGVDSGDRVLEVHDRGDGGFENDVLDAGGVGAADRGGRGVDLDLGVQSVVQQQDARRCVLLAEVADELLRLGERGDSTVCNVIFSSLPSTTYLVESACDPDARGAAASRNSRARR